MRHTDKKISTRQEHDSLGPVDVPHDALYGAQTARAIANFPISGRTVDPALIRAYLRLKAAAAMANGECHELTNAETALILEAVRELLEMPEHEWTKHFPVDIYQAGAGTSQNMNINEVVANVANLRAGEALGTYSPIHPNDHVNRAQSTNDTYPTAMRLALLEVSAPLVEELGALGRALAAKAKAWDMIPKAARTHLQDAVPIRLGQEMGGYAATVLRCKEWITQGRNELRRLGIGGSAAGTGLTVPAGFREAIVRELGILTGEKLESAADLHEAMQSQAPVLFYSSMLRLMAIELGRICNDLRLLASGPTTGFAELLLPATQPGSSIMPGKVNPSILEMANQTFFSVLGHDHAAAQAVQAGQLELNVMMPIMAHSLLEASRIATRAIGVLRVRAIDGLEPNLPRLKRYFESTPQIATALSPRLGYEKTAALVTEALNSGKSVVELVREQQLLSDKDLELLLDARRLTGGA